MELKAVVLFAVIGTAFAGPFSRTDSSCARECTDSDNLRYGKGLTYRYSYTTTSTSLINGTADESTGFQISADVEIEVLKKCDMSLNLKNVRIQEVSPSNEMLDRERVDFFRRTLEEKPLAFSFQDGVIPEICPDIEEQAWALNFKRGVLSHFQSSYFQKQEKSAMETDVTGSCPTKYILETQGYGTQTIKKSKDFMDCTDRQHIESAVQSTIYDPRAPTQSLVRSEQDCDQEIQDQRVKRVSCKEKHVSRPFANHDSAALTKIRTVFEFVEIRREINNAYMLQSQVQTRKTLLFDHKPKTQTEGEDESKVEEVLDEICRSTEVDVRPETAELFTKLVFRMRKLTVDSLRSIHRRIQGGRICQRNQENIEKFFMDAIPMMSTTAAVSYMKEKISSEEVEGIHADMWLMSLAFITHPTKEMIGEVRDLTRYSNPRRSTFLAVSSMIHRYCEIEKRDCLNDDEITSTLRIFEENLGYKCSASSEEDNEKILLSLKALGNSGQIGSATNTLTSCFREEDNPIEIRLEAIEAYRRMPCEADGREELMKMLEDPKVDTEVRIAAYLAVIKCPTPRLLERIHEVLEKEEINQVGSFMWSHLRGLNSTSDPLKQDIRKMLEDTKLMREFNKDPRKFSRAFEGSLFSEKLNIGGTVENHLIFSQESWIPRSAMMNMTAQVFGYSINLFEFGGRVEGFDYLLEKFFGPNGYFPDNNLLEMVKVPETEGRTKRSAIKPDKIGKVKDRFDAQQKNSPRGSMYMKMFGNELSFLDFQKMDWLNLEKESVNLIELMIKLSKEHSKEFTKNMILMESSFDTPTIIGMPLNVAINSTASLNLKISGKADLRKIMVSPRSLNITGAIRPSAAIAVSTEMSMCAFIARTGLRAVTRMHSSTALDGSISLDSSETFKVKFNVPDNRMEIIDVSNKLYLLNAKYPMEIAGVRENYREYSKCTGHIVEKWAGVRLCGELKYPNASQEMNAPYFPLTGPISGKITLDKVDPTLTSYEMEAKYKVQRSRVNGKTEISDILRFMIGTPGTHMPRTHSVDVTLNRAQKALSVDLVSLDKKVFLTTSLVNETDLKRVELNVNYNNIKQYTTSAEVAIDRNERENKVRYMPTIQVRLPNSMDMTLSGTFTHEPQRSLESDVTYQGIGGKSRFVGRIVNDTDMKSIALSVSYNDAEPYTLSGEVGIDRGYQQIRFRPDIQLHLSDRKDLRVFGAITHQTDRSLDIDMTLRGVRDRDVAVTANINGEKWRSLNADVTLKGVRDEDITFTSGIKNEMWRSLNVDMSLAGLTARPLSVKTDIEGERWSRLSVATTLKGIKRDDIVFTSEISGEKWSRLAVDMSLGGVRENEMSLASTLNVDGWRSVDGRITLKGIRQQDMVLSGQMTNQPWKRHDSSITLQGVTERDIVLRTSVSGEKGRSLDGSMTLRGARPTDITLSTSLRGEYMRSFDGSVTLSGVRREAMTVSTSLKGEMGKSFDGSVTLTGIARREITLKTSVEGEPWKSLETSIELTGATKNDLKLSASVSGEKWSRLDGSIVLKGVRKNDISLTTNINGEPWRSMNGHITLRGIRENDISLTANMEGEKGSRFNGLVTLRGIRQNDISLNVNVAGQMWDRLNADITLRGVRQQDIVLSTDITAELWTKLNADVSLKGIRERDITLKTVISGEPWSSLDAEITLGGIRQQDMSFETTITGEKWRSLDATMTLRGVREQDMSFETTITGEKWRSLDATMTLKGIREQDISFETTITGEKWRSLDATMTLKGIREQDISFETTITGEKWHRLNADMTLKGITRRDIRVITAVQGEKMRNLNADLTISGITRENIVFSSKIKGEPWHSLDVDMSLRGAHETTLSLKHTITMELSKSLEVDFTIEGFNKMLDISHKLINNEALKRVELNVNVNNDKQFATSAEVAISARSGNVQYLPTFELHLPNGKNMILRGSIAHQPQRGVDVYFTFSRSGNVELTAEGRFVNVSGEQYTTELTFTHAKLNLKINNDMQYTKEIMGSHFMIEYTPQGKPTHTIEFSETFRNKTADGKHHYEYDSSMMTTQWPEYNYDSKIAVEAAARREGSIDVTVCYGPRTCDDASKTVTFNINMKNESNIYVNKANAAMAVTLPAYSVDFNMDASHENTRHFLQSLVNVNYRRGRRVGMVVELRNDTRDLMKVNALVQLNLPSRQLSLKHDCEEVKAKNYKSETTMQWEDDKKVTMEVEYDNDSDEFKFDHEGKIVFSYPGRDIILKASALNDDKKTNGDFEITYAPNRAITFSSEYKNKSNKRKTNREATIRFDTPFRLFRDMELSASLENTTELYDGEVTLQYAPRKSVSMKGRYQNAGEPDKTRHEVEATFNVARREIHFFTYVQNNSREYEFGNQFTLTPEFGDKKEATFAVGYGNYTDSTKLHHEVSMELTAGNCNMLGEFGFEKTERSFVTETLMRWNQDKQMTFTVNLDNKSRPEQTEFDLDVHLNHPSRRIVLEFHHENTTADVLSRVDLSWEPTSKMTTELVYSKRPSGDKDVHSTQFSIIHPQKAVVLNYNLERNERELNNDFELTLDGKSTIKVTSDYRNGTDSRRFMSDANIEFESELISSDPVRVEYHVERIGQEFNVDSKLTYQKNQEIEIEMSHAIPRKSEDGQRNEVSFKLDTPLDNNSPMKTIDVEGSYERDLDSHNVDLEVQWGRKRRNQKVSMQGSYDRKAEGTRSEHNVEMKLKHPLELPLIPEEPEMTFNLVLAPQSKETRVTYKWSELKEASIAAVYHNYTTSSKLHHLADVIISHPDLEEDIHMTTETKLFSGQVLVNTMVSVIYSPDKEKEIFFKTKAMNKSSETEFRYSFETELHHLYNNIDITLESEVGNTEQKANGLFDLTFKNKEQYNKIKLDGEVNKPERSFIVKTETPVKTIEMQGQFEDRSTAEHTIFYMTLHNKYDGWKEVHSSIDINTRERLFEVTVHHNYERPEDYTRLTAQFLNSTAVEVRAHRNIRGEIITDGLIYARLNTSELLHTRIHWRPQMFGEIKRYANEVIERSKTLRVEATQAMKEKYWELKYLVQDEVRRLREETAVNSEFVQELKKLGEELKKMAMEKYNEMKPELKDKIEEMKQTIQTKYEEIRTKAEEQYKEFQDKYMNDLKETMRQRWEEIREQAIEYYDEEMRPVMAELREAWEDVLDLARKDWDDIAEYWIEQYDELKAMVEEHTKVLREELQEYIVRANLTYQAMKVKLAELKTEVSKKMKEYEQKYEEVRARMERFAARTADAMRAKWTETRDLAMKKYQEYRAIAEQKYQEYKAIAEQKYQEYRAIAEQKYQEYRAIAEQKYQEYRAMAEQKYQEYRAIAEQKYQEYRAIVMQKYQEYRALAMKEFEDAKAKAIATWEEYREELEPRLEEMRRLYEKTRQEVMEKYGEAKDRLQEIYDDIKRQFDEQYKAIMSMREVQEIMEMQALKDVPQIVMEEAKWAWNYWRVENSTKEMYNRSIETTVRLINELKEELKNKYFRFEPENGNIFITVPLPIKQHSFDTLPDIRNTHFDTLLNVNPMDVYYKYRPSMDIWDWIPPHKSHAMIAGMQHYMTFDKKFYEFAGACSYIVASDFIDGNFSVIVNYDRESDKPIKNSLTVISQDKEIEILPDFSVKVNDTTVELPVQYRNTTITREGNMIRVHSANGVTVTCNLPRDVCTVQVSGWYFDKTGGLAGTYNNEHYDDFMTSDRRVTDNAEDLARSWEVGKQCRNNMNRARLCENIEQSPRAEICNNLFMNEASPLRKCFGLVDPQPFRQMCLNDLCEANEVDTEEVPCNAAAAYVSECKMSNVPMYMPKTCVSCKKPNGGIFNKNENIKLTTTKDNVPKSADIVVVVEEKKCNKIPAKSLRNFIRDLDKEFEDQGLKDNRYGLVGFGGEGVHADEHSHTIDSKLFHQNPRKFVLGSNDLDFSGNGQYNDTFRAIRMAAEYPFRTGVAKTIVLLSCSDCSESTMEYREIHGILTEQGISLHVMTDNGFKIKKSSIVIYGLDAKTVFTSKDDNNPYGTKDLREFVRGPENRCTRLAQESNGTVFDANLLGEKSFSAVFNPRMVFTTKPSPCQLCECVEDAQGMGRSVCRPCEEPTPIKAIKLQPSIKTTSAEVKSSKEVILSDVKNSKKFDDWFKKQQ